ncbi:TadE family protein [Virgibacillus flavescens]|uniref:TadE family protein n=1 Tax=Virgibacillus flavescens TaxID=1611422 RepID=UPI003D332E86
MDCFKGIKNDEAGSATIEFLGIVPLAFLLLMIIWQFVVGINGVLITQSAANEYASVYSITKSHEDAQQASNKILNLTGDYLHTVSIEGPSSGNKEFQAQVSVNIEFVFLPNSIFGEASPSVPYTSTAFGRVIE